MSFCHCYLLHQHIKPSHQWNWKTKSVMTNIIDRWACLVTFSKVLTVHLPLMEIKTHSVLPFGWNFFLKLVKLKDSIQEGGKKPGSGVRWRTKNKCITLWQSWPGYNSYQGWSPRPGRSHQPPRDPGLPSHWSGHQSYQGPNQRGEV